MVSDGLALTLFSIGTGLLLVGLAVPLIRGWVKPNRWYGLRIPLTLNDSEIWYPANRYAGWLLLIYGLVLLVASPTLPFLLGGVVEHHAVSVYGLCVAAVMLGGLVPVVILSLRHAHKLERERERADIKVS